MFSFFITLMSVTNITTYIFSRPLQIGLTLPLNSQNSDGAQNLWIPSTCLDLFKSDILLIHTNHYMFKYSSCHPSYTNKILLQPSLAVCFTKIYGGKNVTISLQVSLTKSSNGATHTPFVKPCQVLVANLQHKIACKFCEFLSVKLDKNGRKNIWSVKVGVLRTHLQVGNPLPDSNILEFEIRVSYCLFKLTIQLS